MRCTAELVAVLLQPGPWAQCRGPCQHACWLTHAFITAQRPPLAVQLPAKTAPAALRARFFLGTWNMKGFLSEERPIRTLREVLQRLNDVYCSTIGYEVRSAWRTSLWGLCCAFCWRAAEDSPQQPTAYLLGEVACNGLRQCSCAGCMTICGCSVSTRHDMLTFRCWCCCEATGRL